MIKLISGSKVDIFAKDKDFDGRELVCGDAVIYPKDKGWIYYGWYLGKSPSGKSSYMLTRDGHAQMIYYSLIKLNWQEPVFTKPDSYVEYEAVKNEINLYRSEALGLNFP